MVWPVRMPEKVRHKLRYLFMLTRPWAGLTMSLDWMSMATRSLSTMPLWKEQAYTPHYHHNHTGSQDRDVEGPSQRLHCLAVGGEVRVGAKELSLVLQFL